MPGDARGYSWPPFEKGNTAAQTHGAHSPRVVQPLADRIAAELFEVAPWCAAPVFAAEVKAWAWEEARVCLLQAWVDEHGLLSEESEGALGHLERASTRAGRLRQNLALTPKAWAQVMVATKAAEALGVEGASAQAEALEGVGRELLASIGRPVGAIESGDEEVSDGAG